MNTRAWAAGLLLVSSTPSAIADVSDAQFAEVLEQLRALTERVEELEQQNAELSRSNEVLQQSTASLEADQAETREVVAAIEPVESGGDHWTDRVTWKGDFRFRYEHIAEEGRDDRTRDRIRARPALIAQVNEEVEVGFGLATGGDDPVSTNQTLGGGGSTKDVRLDLAYFDWAVTDNQQLGAGKFKNPLMRAGGWGLLWDGDWRPEGINWRFDNDSFFATLLGNWLESDSIDDDQFSILAQAGYHWPVGENVKLLLGASYFDISTAGKGSFFGDEDEFFGNSFDPVTNRYIFDYELIELFAELGFDLFGRDSKLWADFVHNLDPDEENTGYAVGFRLGNAKQRGEWDAGLFYEDLEKDAALGLLTDSDFGGGGTDVRGFGLTGSYVIAKNWTFRGTYFISENQISIAPRDFDRLMLDLNFKW